MRNIFTLLFILQLPTIFAAREYQLTIVILEIVSNKVLEGVEVSVLNQENKIIASETSDKNGKVVLSGLKDKELNIYINPSGDYQENQRTFYWNKKDIAPEEKILLRFSKEIEESLIELKTEKNDDSGDPIIDPISDPSICTFDNYTEAQFKGGASALQQFIADVVEYPEESKEKSEQGRVYLDFVLEKDGSVSNIVVQRGVSQAIDYAAILALCYMPDWIPATCNGENVRVRCRIPINFSIN